MRVLFNYYAGGGGGFSNILELLKSIAQTMPESRFFIVDSGRSDFSSLSSFPNIELLSIDSKHGEWSRLAHGLWGVRRIAASVEADVIWSMNLGAYLKGKIPQVLSINNAYQVYPLKVLRIHPAGVNRAMMLRLFSWLSMKASSGLILQTSVMKDLASKQLRAGVPKLVAGKAVDYDRVSPEQSEGDDRIQLLISGAETSGRFTFLYVASLIPHKNHQILLDALDILASERRAIRLVLTVDIATLVDGFGDQARRLIEAGLLVAIGWVGKDILRDVYEVCDACLMPSVLESLSSSHLEAMAWERAQIVADMPYAHELCKGAAVYVSPNDADAWANAMVALSADREMRKKLVEAGKAVSAHLPDNWGLIAASVCQFLEESSKKKKS